MAKRTPPKTERLKRLLEAGYFPKELPPPFNTIEFARFRSTIVKEWGSDYNQHPQTYYERFSIPKSNGSRKRLAILNPISYMDLSKAIANRWIEISKFLKKSSISEFRPIFDMSGDRAFYEIDFITVGKRSADILSQYDSVLKSDISRFYPSIYTHSVAWALHGKAYCKAHLRDPAFKQSLGNVLDDLTRKGQGQQSVGIPIGPDTSRVIAEIVTVAIEKELENDIEDLKSRGIRYIDDILIGYESDEGRDFIQASLSRAHAAFELDTNMEKTRVLGVGESLSPEWLSALSSYTIDRKTRNKIQSVTNYFNQSIFLAQENARDNVLTYAVKRSRSFYIDDEVFPYYESFLLRIARKNAATIPAVCQILIESNYLGRPINQNKATKFISQAIQSNARLHHEMEVCWCLFLVKALRLTLDAAAVDIISKMNSSCCILLLLDIEKIGLTSVSVDRTIWNAFRDSTGLRSDMWLLLYEGTLKGWLPSTSPCFVTSDQYFSSLIKRKISFYDTTKNVASTRKELRLSLEKAARLAFVRSHMDEYF